MGQLSGCGQGLITVGGTANPIRPAEVGTWDDNEPGHLFEDDDNTAGSQPDIMQHVNVTNLEGSAS